MADFVAVIRRAVDGLTENTPELRARVYEKARGAVVRQLENMKPRPPEAMFQRQLDKLDAAIRQVEEENSEALPAETPADSAPAPVMDQPAFEVVHPAQAVRDAQPEAISEPAEPITRTEPIHPSIEPAYVEPTPARVAPEHAAHELAAPDHGAEAAVPYGIREHAEPVNVEAAPVEPVYAEPAHVEPTYAEPAYVEPAPVEPASHAPIEAPAQMFEAERGFQAEPIVHAETIQHSEPETNPAGVIVSSRAAYEDEPTRAAPASSPQGWDAHGDDSRATYISHPAQHAVDASPAHERPVALEQELALPQVSYHDERVSLADSLRSAETSEQEAAQAASASEHNSWEPSNVREHQQHDDPLLGHFEPVREPAIRHAANRVMEEPLVDTESEFPGDEGQETPPAHAAPPQFASEPTIQAPVATLTEPTPVWDVDIDREPEKVVEEPAPEATMPRAALTETDVAKDFSDFLKTEFSKPAVAAPPARKESESEFSWDAPFDDLPDLPKPVAFEEDLHARREAMAAPVEAQSPTSKNAQRQDARSELADLIGYAATEPGPRAEADGERSTPDMARAMPKLEGKSFRVHSRNKRRFNPLPIAFGIGAALAVAGGAYAVYAYREDVSALVAGLMPADKAPPASETRAVEEKAVDQAAEKPAETAKTETAKAEDATPEPAATEEQPTEVASLDTNIVPTKFTQRLMADGTEAETDAARIPVDQSLSEGKTVAGQTEVASADTNANAPAQKVETPGLTVAQKMFLYEERLGDSPVAVPGTVSWALKADTSTSGGKQQSMVEATVEVPDRKLKAIVSFKRNTDPSLPASHIIEVVFDLPENFPEGNVESVQRIAFKQTEQDRGNSLIAVPAKITDDFHMIALNDDADARKVNTELMKTRSWIDIPIVYRNNRRALITFEKGSTGSEAFDKAMAEWAALGPTATGN